MKRSPLLLPAVVAAATALGVAGCGKSAPDATSSGGAAPKTSGLSPTTPAAKGDYGKPVVWATYREVGTLDPIQAFDYPEQTVDTALCESLLKQTPDGSIQPGLATATTPDPKTLVLTLKDGPRFWDGKPVTPQDVVWNLERAASTKSGSFFPAAFVNVTSMRVTGQKAVTIKLKQPDYWLQGELSSMPGQIVQKAYGEKAGKRLGSPQGGTMCTGPYKVRRWTPGNQLAAVRNPDYWDDANRAKVAEIDFKGVPDESALTSGLLTGGVGGTYTYALSTVDQLKAARDKVTVSPGPSGASDMFVISSLKGALGDVKVRQALSLAIDRKGYIQSTYKGEAQLPRWLTNPGTWGYGKEVFQSAWDATPEPTQDIAKAKAMIKAAGATGKTITIGTANEVTTLAAQANLVRQAAVSIGMKARIKSVSAQNFINFFTDAKAREGIDGFPTVNYGDYADPASLLATIVMPDGSQNFSGYKDAQIVGDLTRARQTADPDARAKLVAAANARAAEQLPWLALAAPNALLITTKALTGAPSSFVYMYGPWANALGAA